VHKNGALFFGATKESDLGDTACRASAPRWSTSCPATTSSSSPGQTSGATKNVAADELTQSAIDVVE
jgi:hypothetical protein